MNLHPLCVPAALSRCFTPGLLACLALLVALACPAPAGAQGVQREIPDQGDVVTGPVKPVAIFISKLTGRAQYRLNENAQWQAARVGAQLAEGVSIRTGPASAVELSIGATQVITLDRLTTVTLSQAFMDSSQTARTRAELDVGRVKFDVNSHGFSNDVKIRTPDAVLAVVGTTGGVEFVGGVGTSAYGAATNTGTFVLTYADGSIATVTQQQTTSAATPDPAANAAAASEVDVPESRSREPDEAELVSRSTGEGEVFLITTGVTSKPKPDQVEPDQKRDDVDPDDLPGEPDPDEPGNPDEPNEPDDGEQPEPDEAVGPILIDDAVPAIKQILPGGLVQTVAPVAGTGAPMPGSAGGLAVRTNPVTGATQLLRLESTIVNGQVRTIVRGVDLDDEGAPAGAFTVLFDRRDLEGLLPELRGLAGLGGDVYAVGDDTVDHAVYRVDVDTGALTKMMVPGIELQGAAAEASERGTIFIAGVEAGIARENATLANAVILEVDPRINYLVDAHSGYNGDFTGSAATANPDRINPADLGEMTGMAFVEGVLTIATESPGGAVTLQFIPDRTGGGGGGPGNAPKLARLDAMHSISINGLSRDFTSEAMRSVELANPAGRIDLTTLNATFSSMAYSRRAFESGVVERAVRSEILKVARDPSACAASGALETIHGMLESHIDQTAGIGRTVADFRESIFDGHPCQPPAGN